MLDGPVRWAVILLAATGVPAALSLVAGYIVRWLAPRWGLIDQPDARKTHRDPTPLGGGVAIWLAIIATFAAFEFALVAAPTAGWPEFVQPHLPGLWLQSGPLWGLIAAATVLAAVGLADDLWRIRWPWRLGAQLAAAAALVLAFDWRITFFLDLPWLTAAATVLWIAGLTNAFNMLDNMDGLCGGVACITAGTLAALLLLQPEPVTGEPQWFVAGLLLVVVGAAGGFLWHNRPPAGLFMGDAGSYLLGFLISVATVLATYTHADANPPGAGLAQRHLILTPLFVMAVPLYDLVSVVCVRLWEGRSPFEADRRHLSHRLVDLGFSQPAAVLTIHLLTLITCLAAILLHRTDLLGGILLGGIVAGVLLLVALLEWTASPVSAAQETPSDQP